MGAQVGTGPQINTQSCSILEEKGLLYTLVLMHTKTNTYWALWLVGCHFQWEN